MLEETYKDSKPVGVYTISNTIGIEIMDIDYDIEDSVIWRVCSSTGYNYGKSVIKYTNDDPSHVPYKNGEEEPESGPYFVVGNVAVELGEVMAINRN